MIEYKIGYLHNNYFWYASSKSNFRMPRFDFSGSDVNLKIVVFGSDE